MATKWLLAAFALTGWYLWIYLTEAFSGDFVVQDDARQHVIWAYHYLEPGYLLNDPMSEYFEAMAPFGYRALYRVVAYLGFDPFEFNKLLPIALSLTTTYYCFRLSMRILPSSATAFVATALLNDLMWAHDDLPSGTPRAFVYPLLLASFFYMTSRAFWPLLITLVVEAAFYPHALLISFATYLLGLFVCREGNIRLSTVRREYAAAFVLAAASFSVLLPYALKSNDFGPLVTVSEARHLSEFQSGGRSAFFVENLWKFWVKGMRSGLWPNTMGKAAAVCLAFTLLLPFLIQRKHFFTSLTRLTPAAGLLPRLAIASLLLFIAAHVLLFRLHLPSRFTQHSFRIIVALAGAMAIVAIARVMWDKMKGGSHETAAAKVGSFVLLASLAVFIFYPQIRWMAGKKVLNANFVVGKNPDLYRFVQTRARNSVFAVLSDEASLIPSFTRRSVVFANEYAIAYHRGYYLRLKARQKAMETAYLTVDPENFRNFVTAYGVTHFVVDDRVRKLWQSPGIEVGVPILQRGLSGCTVFEGTSQVIDAGCAARAAAG